MEKGNFIYGSYLGTIKNIYKKEGFFVFYTGFPVSAIVRYLIKGIVPYHGSGFYLYSYLKKWSENNQI